MQHLGKEARAVVQAALAKGWTFRMSHQGHAILKHPNGGTVSVSRRVNGRTRANILAEIARVERPAETEEEIHMEELVEVPGNGWRPAGPTGKVLTDGTRYRCTACGREADSASKITGHIRGVHENGAESMRKAVKVQAAQQPAIAWLDALITALPSLRDALAETEAVKAENERLKARLEKIAEQAMDL